MKKILSIIILALALGCDDINDYYNGPYSPETTSPIDLTSYTNVIFDGDSICAWSPFYKLGTNYAVPGSKTYDVYSRRNLYTINDDDCFVLWVGSNNLTGHKKTNSFILDYESICQGYKNVVIISVLARFTFNCEKNQEINKLNYNLYIICERNGWKFLNVHDYYSAHPELFKDGVHLIDFSSYDYLMNLIIR